MRDNKIKGNLRSYLRWPLFLGLLLIAMNIQIYTINKKAGLIMSGYVVLYLVIAIILYRFKRSALLRDLVGYSMRFHVTVNRIATELDIPVAILGPNARCIWENKQFRNLFTEKFKKNYYITEAIPSLTESALPETSDTNGEIHFHVNDIFYKAVIQRINPENIPEDMQQEATEIGIGSILYVVFVYDETEIVHYIRENYDQRLDVGLLYIDNYEESLAQVDDVRRSLLAALVDRKINKYMLNIDAITRKLERTSIFSSSSTNTWQSFRQINFPCSMRFAALMPEKINPSRLVWESAYRRIRSVNVRSTAAAPLIWLWPAAGTRLL